MNRDIKRAQANQSGQIRHAGLFKQQIELPKHIGQNLLLKIRSEFERMCRLV